MLEIPSSQVPIPLSSCFAFRAFRPKRSPSTPKTMPPKGRARKVDAKPNQVLMAEPAKKLLWK